MIDALQLFNGDSLNLVDDIFIKHPTLTQIKNDGYDKYMEYLALMISTSLDIADVLWCENKIWYEDIKNEWDFFIQKVISGKRSGRVYIADSNDNIVAVEEDCIFINDNFRKALNYFIGKDYDYIVLSIKKDENIQNIIYSVDVIDNGICVLKENNFKFTEHFYNITIQYLRDVNWIHPDYDVVKGGNKRAKKYILENDYKKRNRKRKKDNVTLASIVSSLVARGQAYKDIWDYPIYVIYDLYYRLVKVDEYNNTMKALYSGCIDTKKNPIQWDKINWSAVIN